MLDSAEADNSGICTNLFGPALSLGHLIITVTLEFIIPKGAPSGKCRITIFVFLKIKTTSCICAGGCAVADAFDHYFFFAFSPRSD
jgi:hypothetical protein